MSIAWAGMIPVGSDVELVLLALEVTFVVDIESFNDLPDDAAGDLTDIGSGGDDDNVGLGYEVNRRNDCVSPFRSSVISICVDTDFDDDDAECK